MVKKQQNNTSRMFGANSIYEKGYVRHIKLYYLQADFKITSTSSRHSKTDMLYA